MVIVLTGKTGSGRTTVAQYLQLAFGFRRVDRIPKTDAGLVVVDGPKFTTTADLVLAGGSRALRHAREADVRWWLITTPGGLGGTGVRQIGSHHWLVGWRWTKKPNPERVARVVNYTLALMLVNGEQDKLKAHHALSRSK